MNYDDTRTAVKAAFASLRRQNLVARMCFLCCMSCASHALSDIVDEEEAMGAVYFHQQDDEKFRNSLHPSLYIRYFGAEKKKTASVGIMVSAALKAEGLTPIWDGDTGTAILVKVTENSLDLP